MFECWLTINGKIVSSSKEATHSYLKGLQTLDFSHFIKISQIHIWDNDCAKMDIKGRERKRNEKGSADLKIWTKVHGLSRTRWHRFSKTGGTGFCRQHRIYSWLTRLQLLLHPFTPPLSHPRLRTGKGEARGAFPWWFEGSTMGFKDWSKILVLQLGWTGFPSVRVAATLSPCQEVTFVEFRPIYFSRDYLLDSFGRMASIWS
jgi:hypothetical protein